MYEEYNPTHEVEVACRLLKELNDQRIDKWKEAVEKTNYTHSSRKTCNLICKLGIPANSEVPLITVTANKIASLLLKVSKV
jgi:hypothetical protein